MFGSIFDDSVVFLATSEGTSIELLLEESTGTGKRLTIHLGGAEKIR